MKENFGKHLTIILKEMCSKVGADYEKTDFSDQEWYLRNSWSDEQQDSFRDWLVDYWYKNKEARQEMLAFPQRRKKADLKKPADWFIFNYGWKTEPCKDPV